MPYYKAQHVQHVEYIRQKYINIEYGNSVDGVCMDVMWKIRGKRQI